MRHAETIAERIVHLGGKPTTRPNDISIGENLKDILEINREEERDAIDLYEQIVNVSENENDKDTLNIFKRIISDEKNHYQTFSKLLGMT